MYAEKLQVLEKLYLAEGKIIWDLLSHDHGNQTASNKGDLVLVVK